MSTEIERHILRKYDVQTQIGQGAYGVVWRAVDRRTQQVVALKKIFDAFQNSTDAQRTFREIMFLHRLQHPNIIRLLHVHRALNDRDIYLVFEYMETDLHVVIRANILEDVHRRYMTYQLLKTMKYLHSAEILHRDMKPSNLLVNSDSTMKVADFGLARSILSLEQEQTMRPVLTDYVATRWYRPPEILLGSMRYTKAVDMWSVGCILGELLLGKVLFAGRSTTQQLELILSVTGEPRAADIAALNSPIAETILRTIPRSRTRTLAELLPKAPADAVDLLSRLIRFNPAERLTAQQALEHAYVAAFHQPHDEPVAAEPITIALPDDTRFRLEKYRERLYEEIAAARRRALRATDAPPSSPPTPPPAATTSSSPAAAAASPAPAAAAARTTATTTATTGGGSSNSKATTAAAAAPAAAGDGASQLPRHGSSSSNVSGHPHHHQHHTTNNNNNNHARHGSASSSSTCNNNSNNATTTAAGAVNGNASSSGVSGGGGSSSSSSFVRVRNMSSNNSTSSNPYPYTKSIASTSSASAAASGGGTMASTTTASASAASRPPAATTAAASATTTTSTTTGAAARSTTAATSSLLGNGVRSVVHRHYTTTAASYGAVPRAAAAAGAAHTTASNNNNNNNNSSSHSTTGATVPPSSSSLSAGGAAAVRGVGSTVTKTLTSTAATDGAATRVHTRSYLSGSRSTLLRPSSLAAGAVDDKARRHDAPERK